ncbi:MAG: Crp/Fnr family transcriptional regulator [Muribaculaceae bacterium]
MDSIFDTLMALPLFQGISRLKLSELVEKVPFHFSKYRDGNPIVKAGDKCNSMLFLVSGQVRIDIPCQNKRIHFIETVTAPNVIGPEYMFGKTTAYPFNVFSHGVCGTLQITKADYVNMLQTDKVFLFNILNMLSRSNQTSTASILSHTKGSICERIAQMVSILAHPDATDLRISFRQKDFSSMLGSQRTSFINALEHMKADGLIDYSLNEIVIKDRNKLLNASNISK